MGPVGSPYEGGMFNFSISVPHQYPLTPPKLKFLTKIFHPNVDEEGKVCLALLDEKWSPVMKIKDVLTSLLRLVGAPDLSRSAISERAVLFKHRRKHFDAVARAWTREHAMMKSGCMLPSLTQGSRRGKSNSQPHLESNNEGAVEDA